MSNHFYLDSVNDVKDEVCRIYTSLYQQEDLNLLDSVFSDFERLYTGKYPGYHACDTLYHDIHHSLDVTLAMARLVSGYEVQSGKPELGHELFTLGIACALFHDSGLIRKKDRDKAINGAVYMPIHVQRSGEFLSSYLIKIGMGTYSSLATSLLHYTGYEIQITEIEIFNSRHRELGHLLGTADLIAQMSDRCYLEKCRDRLFPEFILGGLTDVLGSDDSGIQTAEDLLRQTPAFYRDSAYQRLENQFNHSYRYAGAFFQGRNLYMDELQNNLLFIDSIIASDNFSLLRRRPPKTAASTLFPFHLLPSANQSHQSGS